jgi:Ferritin-like
VTDELKLPLKADQPIETVEELQKHLYQAAKVEMSTIPLYLYAAYSIKTSGSYQWDAGVSAFQTIRTVVIEEMLHLCLARNLLLSTNPPPFAFYDPDFIGVQPGGKAPYPRPMLHREPPLMLSLQPCTRDLVRDTFMKIERPEKSSAPPQPDRYNTLGQFYGAIRDGLERLAGPKLWARPHTEFQYWPESGYWTASDLGGRPIVVSDLPSALEALDTIVEQGEGTDPDQTQTVPIKPATPEVGYIEYSHYAKFERIAQRIDQIRETWRVPTNPRAESFNQPVRGLAELFNAAFCYVLCMIDTMYSLSSKTVIPGKRSERYGMENTFIAAMGGLLYPLGTLLVQQPNTKRKGEQAAPTFQYHSFDNTRPKKEQLIAMCETLLGDYPSLGGDDGVRSLLDKLPPV